MMSPATRGVAVAVGVLVCVLVIPQWLVRWELGAPARTLTASDKAKAINDARLRELKASGAVERVSAARERSRGREREALLALLT